LMKAEHVRIFTPVNARHGVFRISSFREMDVDDCWLRIGTWPLKKDPLFDNA